MDSLTTSNAPPPAADTPAPPVTVAWERSSGAAQAATFQRLRWSMLRNHLKHPVFGSSVRNATMLLVSAVTWFVVFAISWYGFRFIAGYDTKNPFTGDVIGILFDILFFCLAGLLFLSGGLILYGSLFATPETTFLLTTPIRADQTFAYKFHGAIAFSSWAFVLLGSPVMIAYGVVFGAPWYYYALLPLFAFGFMLIPGSIGGITCLVIVNVVPHLRKQMVIALVGLVLTALPIWLYHLFTTARQMRFTYDAVKEVISEFNFARSSAGPWHWMSQGLQAAQRGDLRMVSYRLTLLIANGLFLYVCMTWLASHLYRRGFNRLATGGHLRKRYGGGWLDRGMSALLGFVDPQTRLLIVKDFRTFRRDPAQWFQILIFLGLIVLYAANMRRIFAENLGADSVGRPFQNPISLINLAATALLLCTYTGRFIYPMLSLEGRKFWILGLLPLQRDRLLWGKFIFSAVWSLAASEGLILVSDLMVGIPAAIIPVHAVTMAAIALGLSGISVGLGATMPNFRETDPSKIAVGFGGTLNLVAGLLFLMIEVVVMAGPWHWRMAFGPLGHPLAYDVFSIVALLIGLLVAAAAVVIPMRKGAESLRRMEF